MLCTYELANRKCQHTHWIQPDSDVACAPLLNFCYYLGMFWLFSGYFCSFTKICHFYHGSRLVSRPFQWQITEKEGHVFASLLENAPIYAGLWCDIYAVEPWGFPKKQHFDMHKIHNKTVNNYWYYTIIIFDSIGMLFSNQNWNIILNKNKKHHWHATMQTNGKFQNQNVSFIYLYNKAISLRMLMLSFCRIQFA